MANNNVASAIKTFSILLILRVAADSAGLLGGLPSGHGYAHLMAKGIDLQTYQLVESVLIKGGVLSKKHDLLTLTPKGKKMAEDIKTELLKDIPKEEQKV